MPIAPRTDSVHHRHARRCAMWLAAVATASCSEAPNTQLLVVVSSEPPEIRFFDRIEVEVRSEDDLTTYDRASFAMNGPRSLPLSFGVAPRGVGASGRVRVVARGLWRDGAERLETQASTSFVEGRQLVLPLVLDVRCVPSPVCSAGLICGSGACVPVQRDPSALAELSPGASLPVADGGACVGAPIDDAGSCDRCAQGSRVAVGRAFSSSRAYVYSTDSAEVTCCGQRVENTAAFYVYPTARPDLLPFYICEMGDGHRLYSVLPNCEGNGRNLGVLGYLLPYATPGRCGSVPLYRLYKSNGNEHLYTTSLEERDRLLTTGQWAYEWTAGYVWASER